MILNTGSFVPWGHLKMSGEIFDCHNMRVLLVGRGYGCAKHPTMHRIAHHNQELSGPIVLSLRNSNLLQLPIVTEQDSRIFN